MKNIFESGHHLAAAQKTNFAILILIFRFFI